MCLNQSLADIKPQAGALSGPGGIISHHIEALEKPFPVLLFGNEYWKGFLDWLRDNALARNYIAAEDLNLLRIVDEPAEAIDAVQRWYIRQEIVGKKAFIA